LAIFEPRSNTTRRAVFQQELPEVLQLADGVFIAQVAALEQIPLKGASIPKRSSGQSRQPAGLPFTSATPRSSSEPLLQPNDVVTIFSNGGFDGIHERMLDRLRKG
jgi:UDP-N-acetylmuramate: L-alanyl-gamma-D-glutamyl-meso-diaminopimelate ligase